MSNTTAEVNGSPMLNPFTPLVFLPPEIALKVEICRYILAGTVGAFIWDILNNINDDCTLLFKHRVRFPTVVYFVSKLSSLGYGIGSLIFITVPISVCDRAAIILQALFVVAIPTTSLLFFFRVRAVFNRNPWVVACFGGLWVAVLGGCSTTIGAMTPAHIGPTQICVDGPTKIYAAAAAFAPLLNDTVVFLAISWRFWRNSYARRTVRDGARVLFFGEYLPAFSRAMLQDGQVYYLVTVTVNIFTIIILTIYASPEMSRGIYTVPTISLTNVMACRVYRNTIFGFIKDNFSSANSGSTGAPRSIIPLSVLQESSNGTTAQRSNTTSSTTRGPALDQIDHIAVTKIVERGVVDDWSFMGKDNGPKYNSRFY